MNEHPDCAWIVDRAKALGFDLCGIVHPEKFPELEMFAQWLNRGYSGEMRYLHDPRRLDPSQLMPDLRSVIICALNYNTALPYSTEAAAHASPLHGWVSRYAWGDDYHEVLWEKLNVLVGVLKERFPQPFAARAYADTGPIAERVFAKHAGLGWLGKNTLLLNETYGSWLFLGVIATSLELPPSLEPAESPAPDLCGNCRQCLDACPTGALVDDYVLDARKCISYLTIELRGRIPEELCEKLGWHVYGCDICQDVCPYNRNAPTTSFAAFQPRRFNATTTLQAPSLEWLAGLDEREFRDTFRKSAVKRTKWAGLVRNSCIALGNASVQLADPLRLHVESLLKNLARSPISTISESALWALGRIQQRPK
jgi:epoxyqueuosine reductase